MARTTITEALAELKTIGKRIEKKQEFVLGYLARQEIQRDPLEKDGGSPQAIEREMQAIRDLGERQVVIRREIARVNADTSLTIGKATRTIGDWLVWRRECATLQKGVLERVNQKVQAFRRDALQKGLAVTEPGKAGALTDVIINVNERRLSEDIEDFETVLGTLDGQLSLKNATTFIEV